MKRLSLTLAASLATVSLATAGSSSFSDQNGQPVPGFVDASRSFHAAIQCNITVTVTATTLASLWTTANCPVALPSYPQFVWLGGNGGGAFWYSTDGQTPVAALTAGTSSYPVAANQTWGVEGGISVNALQLIAGSSVVIPVEVRY